jgi:hypothetical protein
VTPFDEAGREVYEAANDVVVGASDQLVAVWDGEPGNVVESTRASGVAVNVVRPEGARRRR